MLPGMQPGDIIIDGGNSYYIDDIQRSKELEPKGIRYLMSERAAEFGESNAVIA